MTPGAALVLIAILFPVAVRLAVIIENRVSNRSNMVAAEHKHFTK
jgi:hypothetical protein